MLPTTQAQLIVAGRRYTGPINCKVQYHMYNEKATKCIATKLNLEGKEHKVDWTALGALHRRILLRRRVARIKFLFQWAPTNVQQYLNGKSGTKRFPLCNNENEMTTHLFCCKDSNTRDNRMVALDKLEDKLVEGRTHPVSR